MKMISRLGLLCLLSWAMLSHAFAGDMAAAQPPALVQFASEEGLARLSRASAKTDFPVLANQFEAQSNAAFCGPTTAAIVLNAARGRNTGLPRDRSRLRPEDLQYLPPGVDLSLPRYTQDNVIDKGAKKRAQVLGEPVLVNGKLIQDFGYQTRQMDELLRANGLETQLVIVDDGKPQEQVRADLVQALGTPDTYAIVTYKRSAVGQQGGGHISPLGAYDAVSDSFLVLDVNPSSAGWIWMPAPVLIEGMRTFDTVENRGYILVRTP
ncbi:phytochelatin synthase family protein [Rhodoferax sp. GW822-FHT02A01]|uniref:phytochelatin synthase family protein n=1 Tax=Rhodoferax sp. GW822-FHT02A01 TaxID=3141537 RepID=UPI00315DD624